MDGVLLRLVRRNAYSTPWRIRFHADGGHRSKLKA